MRAVRCLIHPMIQWRRLGIQIMQFQKQLRKQQTSFAPLQTIPRLTIRIFIVKLLIWQIFKQPLIVTRLMQ